MRAGVLKATGGPPFEAPTRRGAPRMRVVVLTVVVLTVAGLTAGAALLLGSPDHGARPSSPSAARTAAPHELGTGTLGPVPAGARWVSERGSDAGPGTRRRPWRTLGRAVGRARPGMTIVLEPGTYGARGRTTALVRDGTRAKPITFRGRPDGARPQLLGALRIKGSYQRLGHLLFDGPTGPVGSPTQDNPRGEQVQIAVDDNGRAVKRFELYDSEIRNSRWHAGVFLANAEDAVIAQNSIHDNGDRTDPRQANMSHGIYWASGSGVIANNIVERNVARGIQLYPSPSGVTVTHNTIVGNGRAGVQVAKDASDNLIVNNIVAGNGDGIRSDSLQGTGNRARTNLQWQNGEPGAEESGNLRVEATLEAPPGFASGSLRLSRDSRAVDRAQKEGAVAIDRDGRRRPRGPRSDLGAYESW